MTKKLSDIIAKLQQIEEEHGDLEVFACLGNRDSHEVNENIFYIGITEYISGRKEVLIEINDDKML